MLSCVAMSEMRRATWSGLDGRLVLRREPRGTLRTSPKTVAAGETEPSRADEAAVPGASLDPKRVGS